MSNAQFDSSNVRADLFLLAEEISTLGSAVQSQQTLLNDALVSAADFEAKLETMSQRSSSLFLVTKIHSHGHLQKHTTSAAPWAERGRTS